MTDPPSPQQNPTWMGILCILLGLFPILAALHLLPRDPNAKDAPDFIIFMTGMVFEIAGLAILVEKRAHKLNLALVACLVSLMGSVGFWCAFLSPAEGFSGGLPFLPDEVNLAIGRSIFGLGAFICFGIAGYILFYQLRHSTPPER